MAPHEEEFQNYPNRGRLCYWRVRCGGGSELLITGSMQEEANFIFQVELSEFRGPSAPMI